VIPTARGDLAWGIYAGFRELLAAGRIARMPRLWLVEPFAAPVARARGRRAQRQLPGPHRAVFHRRRHRHVFAVAGRHGQRRRRGGGGDEHARAARRLLTAAGISAELCAAGGLAALRQLRDSHAVAPDAHVVLMLTANASGDPSWPDDPA
jgi:threonine synthase